MDEALLRVTAGIDPGKGTELGVGSWELGIGAEDEIDVGAGLSQLSAAFVTPLPPSVVGDFCHCALFQDRVMVLRASRGGSFSSVHTITSSPLSRAAKVNSI